MSSIVLDATTKTLEVDLNGAVSTTQLPFVGSYCVLTKGIPQQLVGTYEFDGATNSTTAVTLFAAPSDANLVYVLKAFTLKNSDSAAALAWIQLNNNATLREIVKVTLAVGDTLQFNENGWSVLDTSGQLKFVMPGYLPLAGGTVSGALTLSGALTYGGVTLTNAVTGTGKMVLDTSPTLVTPILGTPTSGTLTNCTLPVGSITGLGTGVATFLATPSSANLLAAVTDETGSGLLVFGTSPTILTSLVTTSTTFDLLAGATVQLNIGPSNATGVVAIPGTKASTVSTDGSVTLAGGIGVAGNSNFGGTLGVTGNVGAGAAVFATETGFTKENIGNNALLLAHTALGTGKLVSLSQNADLRSETWDYINSDGAARLYLAAETFVVQYAVSAGATAGAALTWVTALSTAQGAVTIPGTLDVTGVYKAGGTSGVAAFGPAAVASVTVKNGIITAIS